MNTDYLPASLKEKLNQEAHSKDMNVSSLITSILSDYFNLKIHTAFQISTSGALVEGVIEKEMTIETLMQHGNFGLGTFADFDGEMIILDGVAYQAHGNGEVNKALLTAGTPFAVLTDFVADKIDSLNQIQSFNDLEAHCDSFRVSDNLFYAIRIDGIFDKIKVRAVNPPKNSAENGSSLTNAAAQQSEFVFNSVSGTLVGIWSPAFSSDFSVKGYHFHFISDDRTKGGHLLDIQANNLSIQIDQLDEFRLALPENEAFLKADLGQDSSAELNAAERSH